jgi:hypothetical protein
MHNGTRQESAAEGLPVIALALLLQASSWRFTSRVWVDFIWSEDLSLTWQIGKYMVGWSLSGQGLWSFRSESSEGVRRFRIYIFMGLPSNSSQAPIYNCTHWRVMHIVNVETSTKIKMWLYANE